jgi:GNAT superfamily N-acetyltransferase
LWRIWTRSAASGKRRSCDRSAAEIIGLYAAAYEEPFDWLFELLPDSTHVLVRHEGTLVSHAEWVTRWLQPEGQAPIRTAYVEAGATAPERQRRGLATAVMQELQAQIGDYELAALSPDELWARLRPLASRDNEQGVRAAVPRLASLPELLHAAGVSVTPERATVTAALPDGRVVEATLHAADTAPAEWVALWDATDRPPPHWRARPHGENWWTLLDDRETLYVQYSSARDAPGQPLAAWFDAIFARISAGDVSRLVLDLRRNGGGNMALNQPLLHHLIRCDSVNQWGRLFVVIGRDTFSAAMLLAVDLERHTQALFVGEPTGSRPNAYGENVAQTLPHGRLTLTLSGLWWQHSHPADTRPWIEPAIPAALSSANDRANHDPVLAAIATYGLDPAHTVSYAERAAAWIGLAAS